MARSWLQHVPGDEPRYPPAGRALRQHVEPKFRRAPGQRRPHAPRQPTHGCRGRRGWSLRRRPGVELTPMEAFKTHTGVVAPLDRVDVDTDQIIPKQFLKSISRTGFEAGLFYDLRFLPEG